MTGRSDMPKFEALTRDQAGRMIPILDRQINELSQTIGKIDGVLLLLCLEDAFDNLLISVLQRFAYGQRSELDVPPEAMEYAKVAMIRHITSNWMMMIGEAISKVCVLGKPQARPETARSLPTFETFLGLNECAEDALVKHIEQGKIRE